MVYYHIFRGAHICMAGLSVADQKKAFYKADVYISRFSVYEAIILYIASLYFQISSLIISRVILFHGSPLTPYKSPF